MKNRNHDKEYHREYRKKNECNKRRKTTKTLQWAKCPQCEMGHLTYIEYGWTGRGIPRIACDDCKKIVSFISSEEEINLPNINKIKSESNE